MEFSDFSDEVPGNALAVMPGNDVSSGVVKVVTSSVVPVNGEKGRSGLTLDSHDFYPRVVVVGADLVGEVIVWHALGSCVENYVTPRSYT